MAGTLDYAKEYMKDKLARVASSTKGAWTATVGFAKSAATQVSSSPKRSIFAGIFGFVVLIIVILGFALLDSRYVTIGFLPFIFVAAAMLVMGIATVVMKVPAEAIAELVLSVGTIAAIVIGILLFISHVCLNLRVTERFEDVAISLDAIRAAEAEVCKLVVETNNYIQSDIGQAGSDNPSLVTAAQQKAAAAAAATGPILGCPLPAADEGLQPEERLDRMDRTLDKLVEPELKRACAKAGVCNTNEGFDSAPATASPLQTRLDAIVIKIKTINALYLAPMKQKQADLQSGKASDSDKQKGAAAAGSGTPPAP